jgi:Collagen triple helix repeat (20 copies)
MTLLGTRAVMIGAGVVLVLGMGSTAAYAALAGGPVDGSGVIHGCWTNAAINGTHVIVLQDAGTTCPKGTTAISWNQQGPAGPTGPVGATGAAGPAGPAGATGPAGPKGDAGAQGPAGATGPAGVAGPAGPAGADGSTVLNGTGPSADTVGHDGDFYLDTAAEVLYGPKAGGGWPANGTSLTGVPGATGPAGPQGPPGPAGSGGLSAVTDLNGLTCTTNGGADGTIAVQPASPAGGLPGSDNLIAMKCNASQSDANCIHSNGEGQNYTDCNDLLGDPATGSGYNEIMAAGAAQVYPGGGLGPVTTECAGGALTGSAIAVQVSRSGTTQQVLLWQYSGINVGHVHAQTIDLSQQVHYECPTSSDPTWN